MNYHDLPELDTSFSENDLGGMVSTILAALSLIGFIAWALK